MEFSIKGTGKSLGAAHLFRIAKAACERLQTTDSHTSGGKDDALVSIVFSAASIEAFFNELPEMLSFFPELLRDEAPQVPAFVGLAEELEASKGSINLKYLLAYSILSGSRCNKGGQPYQDFVLLIEARNGLMNMKPNDFSVEARPGGTPMEPDLKFIRKFRALGILDTSQPILPFTNVNATQSDASLQIRIPLPLNFQIATGAAAC